MYRVEFHDTIEDWRKGIWTSKERATFEEMVELFNLRVHNGTGPVRVIHSESESN